MRLIFKNIILLLLASLAVNGYGQFTPPFKNYSVGNVNAGNQNWGVARAEDGMIYIANNKGLLQFDGLKWSLHQIPNKTTIRSVFTDNGRIYIGSYEEFGFWEKDAVGILRYHSLSDGMIPPVSSDEEIWQILKFEDKIIFRSFLNIYIYFEDGKILKQTSKSVAISCSAVNDQLFVSTLNHGIFELKDAELVPFFKTQEMAGMKIINISSRNDKLFITTALQGCFYLDNKLSPINTEISKLIKQHQLNTFTPLSNGNMVFGTIKNGVYVTDTAGRVLYNINKQNGLANNTVLAQFLDFDQHIWLGLDNGISSIDLKNKVSFYNDVSGRLGAVYDVIKFNDTFYIGSNTGLFFLDKNNELQFIEGSQGQVWSLDILDQQLICGHNNGTFLVDGKKWKQISQYTGGWNIRNVIDIPKTYIQGTYAGLVKLDKQSGTWTSSYLGKTTMPLKYIAVEDSKTIWAAHVYKGLYRISIKQNWDSISRIVDYRNKGIGPDFNIRIYRLRNAICFKTNDGWKKFEPLIDSIVPHGYLNKVLGRESYIISEDYEDGFVLKTPNDALSFRNSNQEENFVLSSGFFDGRLIVGYENISSINDSIYALNLNDGFALINKNLSIEDNLLKPQISNIQVNRDNKKIGSGLAISYGDNVRLEMSSPKSSNYHLEYRLSNEGRDKWTKLENNLLSLNNLPAGKIVLSIRANNELGTSSPVNKFQIDVDPPWYRDTLGYIVFFIIILSIGLMFYFLHKRRIAKEQLLLKREFEEEQKEILLQKTIENEKRIVTLKNEALKNEVQLKSKQLANTAMALVRKNETLLDIKQDLVNHKSKFDNYYSYKKLLKRVDNSIAHKDEWEIFEENFNQVHEEFFNEIRTRHPNLNNKDLKVCAYIKMNLSTKEIAPLMNISIRGVETYRYRLKKKLNLENDISMTDYLLNIE